MTFLKTNVFGAINLMNTDKEVWKDDYTNKLFYHFSTDEVDGALGETGYLSENTLYDPQFSY